MADDKTFTIGITMAGAVSAGAYTAGVLDFLLRAIDMHNDMVGTPGGPEHRVVLKVMSGASAGGISAALSVAALLEGFVEGQTGEIDVEGEKQTYDISLPVLHEMWVQRIDLSNGDSALLSLEDLEGDKPVISLINSEVLDHQADAALGGIVRKSDPYGWIASDLEVFLSTTDLDGVPFVAPFADAHGTDGSTINGHPMARHAFARHFRVRGLGTRKVESAWLKAWGDEGVPLDPPAKGEQAGFLEDRDPWHELKITALASGAFPAGLASRFINLTADEIYVKHGDTGRGGALPLSIDPARRPAPSDEYYRDGNAKITLHTVDGGVCNNEPFELARYTLRPENPSPSGPSDYLLRNPSNGQNVDRAIIMIDPFPEGPGFRGPDRHEDERAFFGALGKLMPTLLDEARFKPMELVRAADPGFYSRMLISPSRSATSHELETWPQDSRRRLGTGKDNEGTRGAEAIASGLLGGFGGFLHDTFRAHDFILGQRNCQWFLLRHFNVAANNPFDHTAPAASEPASDELKPVIKMHESLLETIELPPWPVLPKARHSQINDRVRARIDRLAFRTLRDRLGAFGGRVAYLGWSMVIRRKAVGAITSQIKNDLSKRSQLQ